ncbi:pleckstrin homology domain-containing family G member 6-like [Lissotriton helveticus]
MLGFHSAKSWNVPHEIPSNMFYDVGMMGESKKKEKEEQAEPVGEPSAADPRDAGIEPHQTQKELGTKSTPTSPRTIPGEHPLNNHRAKSKTVEQGPQKRRKRLPDYVTFSRATTKNLTVTPVSINDVELERKKDSLERKVNNSKISTEVALLRNKLTAYSMYGLPRLSRDIRLHWEIREGNETSIRLENSWRDIVRGHENMSRKYSHQQEAVWELLCTELSYMKKLRIMTDLVICTLLNLHDANFLTEIHPENLFSNIAHIIRAHRSFWQEVISPVLEEARRTRQPFDPMSFQEGFQTFPERFKAYTHYCLEVKKKMEFARVQYKDNELFRVFVSWVEKHKQSHRLRLSDMLMRPHQRITKYSLLLKAILKRTEDPATREALNNMVSSVEQFLQNVNTQMQRGEDYDKLRATMDRIGAYDILEPGSEEIEKKLKAYTTLDLTCPISGVAPHNIRQLLKEGPLKMKDGKEARMEVHGLLFTDTFLITKMHRKTELAKVVRSPLMLDKTVVQPLRDPSSFLLIYLNEFGCVALALSFQCASAPLCKEWTDKFTSAQESLKALKAEEIRRQEQERRTLFLSSDFQNDLATLDNSSLSRWSDDTAQDARSQSEFPIAIPRLIITEDDQTMKSRVKTGGTSSSRTADASSSADEHSEVSDPGYGTLPPPMGSLRPDDMEVNTSTDVVLREQKRHQSLPSEDQRMTVSTSDLRHRHLSEPFDLIETSTASSGKSPKPNRELRRSMPLLSHIEQSTLPKTSLKVHVTRLRPLPKYTLSTPRPFLKAPEAYRQSDPEEESSDSSFTARPLTRAMRGPSLVMETLRRAKHRETNWRHSLTDSVELYSDSQSDLSDAEELEVESGSPRVEFNQDGRDKVIPREKDLSRLSLQEQEGEQNGHPRTVEIELTEDLSNPSDSIQTSELLQVEDDLVSADEEDPTPNGAAFKFERSDSQDFQDDLDTTEAGEVEDPVTPWLLSPNEFLSDSGMLNLSHMVMEPLLTEDIFLDIVRDASHQRRRMTKAELRRIRSIKIDSTTSVSEV